MSTTHNLVAKLKPASMTLALVVGALLPVNTAFGAELTDLNGRWKSAETKEEAANKKKAIEEAVSSFPRFIRSKARSRMSERMKTPGDLEIAIDGKKVRLGREGKNMELELGAPPKAVSREGKNAKVSASHEGATLIVKTEAENGAMRIATYRPKGDGHLLVGLRMQGGKLDKPLAFQQTYAPAQ